MAALDLFGRQPARGKGRAIGERPHYPQPVDDLCDRKGAERLKARIEEYWRERGHEIEACVVEAPFFSSMRSRRFDVRSNLRNGLPLPSQERAR